MVAMGIEFSGERPNEPGPSVENVPRSQRINSLTGEILSETGRYDSAMWSQEVHGNVIYDPAAVVEHPPIFPMAHTLAESVRSVQGPAAGIGTSAESVRKAREATRELRKRLGLERKYQPESASLAGVLARAQELEGLLVQMEADSSRLAGSVAGTERPTMFDVVGRLAEGEKVVARVGPRPHPATLDVAAPSHGRVRVSGLARFFPAHTIHARRSTAVVTADGCELRSVDHYHVHRVSVSLDALMEPGAAGHSALQHLLEDPTGSGIAEFQRAMQRIPIRRSSARSRPASRSGLTGSPRLPPPRSCSKDLGPTQSWQPTTWWKNPSCRSSISSPGTRDLSARWSPP